MSNQGPPADAKQAQAAALQELEAAQRKKRVIDTSLVGPRLAPGLFIIGQSRSFDLRV
jgi:hypothetical protein